MIKLHIYNRPEMYVQMDYYLDDFSRIMDELCSRQTNMLEHYKFRNK